jgi:hypothetical protein
VVLPLLGATYLCVRGYFAERAGKGASGTRAAVAVALAWLVLSYFPVSNIPVVLPTVRAERFWYFPILGTCVIVGLSFDALVERLRWSGVAATLAWLANAGLVTWAVVAHLPLLTVGIALPLVTGAYIVVRKARLGVALFTAWLGFQCFAARNHANDYTDDLVFWDATRKAVPRSAKAHLNYSVMQGARGRLDLRLEANKTALDLAPEWPMASVYYGDTLCRLHRPQEAWPHYEHGFDLAANDVNLIALGVQCLWDEQGLTKDSPLRDKLSKVAEKHPGSWLDYVAKDTLENGEEHKGVDPKYRPRGYNEGPKQE